METKIKEYISAHKTEIPRIQRDYVQGSDLWASKRDAFLDNLISVLKDEERDSCKLDFIYGSEIKEDNYFVPFDGQQRLTTLNLLGWMLANRSNRNDDMNKLGLRYNTRESSREFCEHLFTHKLAVGCKPSEDISEQIWFAEQWKFDPTVKSILEMLDAIDIKLKDQDVAMLARRFFDDGAIEFEMLDLDMTGGADDLYIKINARGKKLTDFEHWKSAFIGFLRENHAGKLNEFERKIEHDWCDFFWDYAISGYDTNDKENYPRIDEYFMRFFHFVTDILYAKSGNKESIPIADDKFENVWREVYKSEENVKILFDMLNALADLKDKTSVATYFGDLFFSTTDPTDKTIATDTERINIFKELTDNNVDILSAIIIGTDVSIRAQLLLWGAIQLKVKLNMDIINPLREWWIYLQTGNRRQRTAKTLSLNANIRLEDIPEYLKHLSKSTATSRTDDEKKLINHPWLRGDLRNVNQCAYSDFERFASLSNKDRIRGLIALGWTGTPTKGTNFVTFGIEGGWEYIFTGDLPEFQRWINTTDVISPNISDWLAEFVYHYIDDLSGIPRQAVKAFHRGIDRELFGIDKDGSMTLIGYKLDPIAYVVAKKAGALFSEEIHWKHHIGTYNNIEIDVYNENRTCWCISIPKTETQTKPAQLKCMPTGWKVLDYDKNEDIAALLIKDPCFTTDPTTGIVNLLPGKDLIETGAELFKEVMRNL